MGWGNECGASSVYSRSWTLLAMHAILKGLDATALHLCNIRKGRSCCIDPQVRYVNSQYLVDVIRSDAAPFRRISMPERTNGAALDTRPLQKGSDSDIALA